MQVPLLFPLHIYYSIKEGEAQKKTRLSCSDDLYLSR